MEYRTLGNTGIKVSRLCFGSLTIGPLQANLSIDEGAKIIRKALELGINFIDTAKLYNTYPYIKKAGESLKRENIIISSRSYDYTYEGMKESLEEALCALGTKYIDIFGLHEQEDKYTLMGHMDAVKYLVKAKKEGIIRAVSISTHNVRCVRDAAYFPEIDIIHPLLNNKGIGIGDGNVLEMMESIEFAQKQGKGIYSMKPLGGGNLLDNPEKCFNFLLSNNNIDSIAAGMQTEDEVICNTCIFEGKEIPESIRQKLKGIKRRLHIDTWCEGCGRCVQRCTTGALKITNGKCVVDINKCRLCGYCSSVCPEFCIKVI